MVIVCTMMMMFRVAHQLDKKLQNYGIHALHLRNDHEDNVKTSDEESGPIRKRLKSAYQFLLVPCQCFKNKQCILPETGNF